MDKSLLKWKFRSWGWGQCGGSCTYTSFLQRWNKALETLSLKYDKQAFSLCHQNLKCKFKPFFKILQAILDIFVLFISRACWRSGGLRVGWGKVCFWWGLFFRWGRIGGRVLRFGFGRWWTASWLPWGRGCGLARGFWVVSNSCLWIVYLRFLVATWAA